MSVLFSVLVVTAAAAVTDLASLHFRARSLQGLADTAALSAARDPGTANETVRRILTLKRSAATIDLVVSGQYHGRSEVPLAQRFEAGGAANDAVRVVLSEDVHLFFGSVLGIRAVPIHKAAVAVRPGAATAGFSIGSRLLRLEPTMANALLSGLTGQELRLTAVSYEGLVTSSIDVDQLLRDIGRTLSVGDRQTLLDSDVSTRTLVDTMARQTSGDARHALDVISGSLAADPERDLNLGALIDVDPAATARIDARVPAWDLLAAVLGAAAEPKTIDLTTDLDGAVTSARIRLAIGEREQHSPWLTVTRDGSTVVRTSQIRLHVDLTTVNLAGVGRLRLPLYAEVASGEASLAGINCRDDSFEVAARSGLAKVWLGDVNPAYLANFSRTLTAEPGAILDTAVLRVRASARAEIGTSELTRLQFDRDHVDEGKALTVGSGDILGSTLSSLVGDARFDIEVLGLGLTPPDLQTRMRGTLSQAAAPLDEVLDGLLALAGVGLGEADVRPAGLGCELARVANLAA